jgi:hypothetical protein
MVAQQAELISHAGGSRGMVSCMTDQLSQGTWDAVMAGCSAGSGRTCRLPCHCLPLRRGLDASIERSGPSPSTPSSSRSDSGARGVEGGAQAALTGSVPPPWGEVARVEVLP